jgi:hypothetical protein
MALKTEVILSSGLILFLRPKFKFKITIKNANITFRELLLYDKYEVFFDFELKRVSTCINR